jgi:NADH:ubiquinone oxidoreductase subunit 3 (subunit A)
MQSIQAGTTHYAEFGVIASLIVLVIVTVAVMMALVNLLTRVIGKIKLDDAKATTYECGEAPVGSSWFRFNNRFYLTAILFLVFDVELVLVLPLLVRFTHFLQIGEGAMIFAKVFLFVGTLLLGLIYAGVRGDLSWNKSVVASKESSCE